ncbi:peptidoglycan/LPS O-acetylase OafA/YrhL [Ureibacillus xyleni]|uniref:Peptidoglycan/LPS O-acetylase OafA/YrhL n=1 Tax=Ureibacillus xyleni TaxID=614648 RepID=A0A285R9H9_9BACL|nr:acyltransferase [Ureibacillus xyleni]SOB90766.1 peptidoglycan/LPS O-acetylase OafA/YrhL [Ureibacillus xyleni]
MVSLQKERVESIKFMRVVAMLLVVLIHTTGIGIRELTPDNPFYFLYLFLNRFTRFEGAVFVFLSGFVLFYNYESRPYTVKTWTTFYKKRFMYILGPFLVWSIFYQLFSFYMGTRKYIGIGPMIENIATGQSYYQLYFILILVQLYFLLPVFIYFIQKFHWFKKYLLLIGFIIELGVQVLFKKYNITFALPLFTGYLASFFFGGWVAMYYPKLKKEWSRGLMAGATIFTVALGILYMLLYYQFHILDNPSIPYAPFKILAMIYYLSACFILFKWSIILEKYGSIRFNEWAERLRVYSFGYYLVHPFILELAKLVFVPQTLFQFHLFIFIRYIVVVIGCYVFIRVIHILLPRAWMIFGKLPSWK